MLRPAGYRPFVALSAPRAHLFRERCAAPVCAPAARRRPRRVSNARACQSSWPVLPGVLLLPGLPAYAPPPPVGNTRCLDGSLMVDGRPYKATQRLQNGGCAPIIFAASDRSIRLSEFAKAELSDYREKRSDNQCALQ